jgi:polysaccharide biosynthesis protein PslG
MALWRRTGRASWRVRLGILSMFFLILVALLARTIYGGLAGRFSTISEKPLRTIPNTDVNPYGANFFLDREVEPWKLDKTLQMASEAGIGWVKQQFPWEAIEPRRKGEFLEPTKKTDSWAKYDEIVALCEKYNLQIIARLDRPPDWTRQDNTYKESPPDRFEDYGDFVYAFVKHYEGRINYIQIWNEPNIFPEWGNHPVDPAQYVALLEIAYRRAKEANPNVYVLSAPLAMTLGEPHPEAGKWRSMNDLMYLEEMYKAGASAYFDIYSTNAFGFDRSPEDAPEANTLNFQRVLLQRKIMERYGDSHKAVWLDEYGWNAAPDSFPAERLTWKRVSEKQQAEYTVRGIELARRDWPWMGVAMIWYFRQVGNISGERADYFFRMVDTDFTPRLPYLAVQEVARREDRAGPGLYQETNPGVKPYGHWRTVIDPRASGQAYLRSDVAGDSVTFTFQGSAIDLISPRNAASGRLLVSLDGRPVLGLPSNSQGFSYVDLYNATAETLAHIPLVRGASAGEHTLRITVAEEHPEASTGSEGALDAFEVISGQKAPFPWIPLGIALVGLGLDIWLWVRTWRRVRWSVRAP